MQNYIMKLHLSCVLLMGTVMPQDGRKTTEDNMLGIEQHTRGEKFFAFSAQTQISCENTYYMEESRVEV